jgi:SWI/SNF-related matrix-associated actin-dependent regulator of chromatin subfamily A-like protein 1
MLISVVLEPTKKYAYALECPFSMEVRDFCRILMKRYGYKQFGFDEKKWRFNDIGVMDELLNKFQENLHITDEVRENYEKNKVVREKTRKSREATAALKNQQNVDMTIPGLKGELYPYQKIGVAFLEANGGRAIIADSPGVGKTAQTIAYVLKSAKRKTLVVCPASVKYSWELEVQKWTKLKSFVISSKSGLSVKQFQDNDIFIVNYDILSKFLKFFLSLRFDCLVLDEVHFCKNPTSQRTKAAMILGNQIESIVMLSGTPILNRPVEIYNALKLLDPKTWGNYYSYVKRYCAAKNTYFGLDVSGASNVKELQKKIAPYFIRRTKEEVLTELPKKQRIYRPVKLKSDYLVMYKSAEDTFKQFIRESRYNGTAEKIQGEKLKMLNELRQITSAGKVYAAKEIIDEILNNGEKILVFSVYNKPLEELHEHYGSASVMLVGSTSQEGRKEAIDSFQNDSSKKVFLGGTVSAGVGITLTAASNVLFIDFDYTPANHLQAENRCHRPGQEASHVTIYQLYAKDTIDDHVRCLLLGKQLLIDDIVNDTYGQAQNFSLQDTMNGLVKSYEAGT